MRFVTLFALAIGVALLVASIGLGVRERSQKQLDVDHALQQKVVEEAQLLESYFARARSVLLLTANSPAFLQFYELPGSRAEKAKAHGPVVRQTEDALAYLEKLYPTSIGEACFIDRAGAENSRVVRGERAAFGDLSLNEQDNPFFKPTFALRPGQVYQAKPYVSPDTGEWVISNSTPLAGANGSVPAMVHFEVTVASFRREASALAGRFGIAIVDADTGKVIVNSQLPQRVGGALGQPADRRFVHIVQSGARDGVTEVAEHRSAFMRLAPLQGNANDWYVVATNPVASGRVLADVGVAAMGMAGGALALLVFAAISFRGSRRALQVAAHTDSLTGLRNRRQLMSDLESACEAAANGERRFGLMLFDLDGFKAYNDTFGHVPGDALLRRLAQKLAAAVEGWGAAYRLGGDEFCVLVPLRRGGDGPEDTAAIGLSALSEAGRGFTITSSCGTVVMPDHASSPSDALATADLRMYAQKSKGRSSPARQTTDVLVRVLHERSPLLGPHAVEVAELAEAVGRRVGLTENRLERLRLAAELHDVGKIAIPDGILEKPGPLSDEDWSLMREHTIIGERILSTTPTLGAVAKIVRATHERIDGVGYPDGLASDAIPIEARIIAVADAYTVMVSKRPYALARSSEAAITELRRCSGTQFDPVVVDALADAIADRPLLAQAATI